jgi:hypothetical protein
MKKTGAKKGEKKVAAVVKSLVEIKGSIYLCIPKVVARKCGLEAGNLAAIVASGKTLTVFFPEVVTERSEKARIEAEKAQILAAMRLPARPGG